jgi:hypothetical protein
MMGGRGRLKKGTGLIVHPFFELAFYNKNI